MATIMRHPFEVPGALGPILVDLRTSAPETSLPAVVIHHGFKGFKDWALLPPFAERMARAGFHAVTLSVSGAGVDGEGDFSRPERFAANTYSHELDDLGAVLRALRAGALGVPAPPRIGLVGHSRGGGMALCLTREDPALTALVTWAAISRARRHDDATLARWKARGTIDVPHARLGIDLPLRYDVVEDCLRHEHGRLDIPAAAAALHRPWLLVHGSADDTVPLAEARALEAASPQPSRVSRILEGAGHTFGAAHPWSGPTADTTALFDVSARFLVAHLG